MQTKGIVFADPSRVQPNGAADQPRKAGKLQALPPGVGSILGVVQRFAPRNQRMASAAPLSWTLRARDNAVNELAPRSETTRELNSFAV